MQVKGAHQQLLFQVKLWEEKLPPHHELKDLISFHRTSHESSLRDRISLQKHMEGEIQVQRLSFIFSFSPK